MVGSGLEFGSLFSGIGGLDRGLESLGMKAIWQCEVDQPASRLLTQHWDVPNFGDIASVDWRNVPVVDVLAGGFPCQDISVAGKGVGLEGSRSGLWKHFAAAIDEIRPPFVFVENVSALLTRGLDTVLGDLNALNYSGRWGLVRASDVGAPHRRERMFIAAELRSSGSAIAYRPKNTVLSAPARTMPSQWRAQSDRLRVEALADELRAEAVGAVVNWGQYRPAISRWEAIVGTAPAPVDDAGRLAPEFVEWMMGLPIGWTAGVGRGQRLRGLGNAVVPQQASYAWNVLSQSFVAPRRDRAVA